MNAAKTGMAVPATGRLRVDTVWQEIQKTRSSSRLESLLPIHEIPSGKDFKDVFSMNDDVARVH
jgi:hypothetical protein